MEELSLGGIILSTLSSVGIIGVVGYLSKNIILKYAEKRISYKFEKELEKFRGDIREKESHIALINTYLTDLSRNRSKLRSDKQIIAVEDCFKLIKILNKTNFMIEMLVRINFKKVFADKRELELQSFFEQLYLDFNVESILTEIREFNDNSIDLYLDSKSLNNFNIFKGIIFSAIAYILAFKDKTTSFLKKEDKELVNLITKFLPQAKASFEEYGDEYIFQWHSYFFEQTKVSLRNFISGDNNSEDIVNIQNITMSSRKIYNNLPSDLKK